MKQFYILSFYFVFSEVVLYEEDISMLTDSFKTLSKMIEEKPKVTEGKSTLEGNNFVVFFFKFNR